MKVAKTIKLYIGGEFPRTESGRTYPAEGKSGVWAHLCQSSRKDFRNAVDAAKNAQESWAGRTAYNKSQIIYRMAEMLEGKRDEFISLFEETLPKRDADKEVQGAIDALVYYAGFADKFQQLAGSFNPVSGPYHNFSAPAATGVVTYIAGEEFSFSELVSDLMAIIIGGNSVVALLGPECPAVLAPLAEVFATSDLPGGVINLLTGHLDELGEVMAGHREVRALVTASEEETLMGKMQLKSVENMKRFVRAAKIGDPLEKILSTVEFQTVWHPIGQ